MTDQPTGVWVRATVHLPKLPRGNVAYVNPADPEVISALRATWIVPLPGQDWQELNGDPEMVENQIELPIDLVE